MNLKKKVGPLPVYGWIGAVALGILIYYWRKNSSSAQMVASTATPTPTLDPTNGASFPMPDALSSGGTTPETTSYPTALQEVGDVNDLYAALGLGGIGPAAGQPQEPTTGSDAVSTTLDIIHQLQASGLIAPAPANTGAAAAPAQPHTTSTAVADRVTTRKNTRKGNPRAGLTYRVVTNPKGQPKGRYHVYGKGKSTKYIKVHR